MVGNSERWIEGMAETGLVFAIDGSSLCLCVFYFPSPPLYSSFLSSPLWVELCLTLCMSQQMTEIPSSMSEC